VTAAIRALALPAARPTKAAVVILAALGASLLLIVALARWAVPSDEYAYWLAAKRLVAGLSLYDPSATPGTPYAYFYPPPAAQVLAPFTSFVPDAIFVAAWTVLLLACIWWLAGGNIFVALALVAFIPISIELWYRNVHLVLAVLIVLGLRRHPGFFAVATAIKVTPVLGLVYLLARRRYRDALATGLLGLIMLVGSVVISPGAWHQFANVIAASAGTVGASLVPVPFPVRAMVGLVLALAAGRLRPRLGEPLLVIAIVIANPTLWLTALSMLAAVVPLLRSPAPDARASTPTLRAEAES
jgi:Glycosyltransferase family 87